MTEASAKLLSAIQSGFERRRLSDKKLGPLYWAIQDGVADYETVNLYAIRLGELLAEAIKREVSAEKLPGGQMTLEIASEILGPLLSNNQKLVADAAVTTQNALNRAAKIGLKAVRPELNQNRVQGLIHKISEYDEYKNGEWVLDEPVVTFTQSVVDDSIRENVEAHAAAGLHPIVQRLSENNGCDWCRQMAGFYAYPVDRNVYRRHERCRCMVVYDPETGKIQDVHAKVLYADAEKKARDARIAKVLAAEKRMRSN